MTISAIDLFCGAGGLTYGLRQAGINVEAGIDVDPRCRYPYETNNEGSTFYARDIGKLAYEDPKFVTDLLDSSAETTMLAGCAPCQPFSPLTHGVDSSEHESYGLLKAFGELIEEIEPDFLIMENVYEVRHHDVYHEFIEKVERLGYSLNPEENRRVFCPEFGIPQTRRRWVVVGSRKSLVSLTPTHENPEEYPTVQGCIGGGKLDPIKAGEPNEEDPLHTARDLEPHNLERVRYSKPGGTWKDWVKAGREDLLLECHKKDTGSSYQSVYGRMEPDKPAPTITTQFYNLGSGRFGHYDTDQDRALSLREGAMIQSFPQDYDFIEHSGELEIKNIGQMIGNAVPPRLGEVIGRHIQQAINGDRQSLLQNYH